VKLAAREDLGFPIKKKGKKKWPSNNNRNKKIH
jgi:hypothetical protein